jgi:hypothetical protein
MARSLRGATRVALAALSTVTLLSLASVASAHEEEHIGKVVLEIGWAQEPAFAGLPNAVQLSVGVGDEPVEDAALTAVVVFGDSDSTTRTDPLPLDPVADAPGEYRAFVIPTRPGTYTFEITGKVAGKQIDETFTSGEQTFDEVLNPGEAQFPEQDPTQGELAERLERIDARIGDLRTEVAALGEEDEGSAPLLLGIAGILLGALALAFAVAGRRQRRAA